LIAIDARGATVFISRSYRKRVAVGAQLNRPAKVIIFTGVGCLYVGLLAPVSCIVSKNIYRSGTGCLLIILVAVYAGCTAVFNLRANRKRISIIRSLRSDKDIQPLGCYSINQSLDRH
jgi:hypothetical protein